MYKENTLVLVHLFLNYSSKFYFPQFTQLYIYQRHLSGSSSCIITYYNISNAFSHYVQFWPSVSLVFLTISYVTSLFPIRLFQAVYFIYFVLFQYFVVFAVVAAGRHADLRVVNKLPGPRLTDVRELLKISPVSYRFILIYTPSNTQLQYYANSGE